MGFSLILDLVFPGFSAPGDIKVRPMYLFFNKAYFIRYARLLLNSLSRRQCPNRERRLRYPPEPDAQAQGTHPRVALRRARSSRRLPSRDGQNRCIQIRKVTCCALSAVVRYAPYAVFVEHDYFSRLNVPDKPSRRPRQARSFRRRRRIFRRPFSVAQRAEAVFIPHGDKL